MATLYKNTLSSKAENSQNVNKQSNSHIRGCNSFPDGYIKLPNSLYRRDNNLSPLATRVKTKIDQYHLHSVTIEWLYNAFDKKISKKTLIEGCKELEENKKLKSKKVQVGKFKHKYVFDVMPEQVNSNYFLYDNRIANINDLSHNAFLIAGYLQTHDESFYHNLTLEKIGYDTNIRKSHDSNRITTTKALNELLEKDIINRKVIRVIKNGKEVNRTIYFIKNNVDKSVDKSVDNFSNEAEIKKSTSAQNYTVYNSTPNKDKNLIKKNIKERNFKKVLNKSISLSQITTDVVDSMQLLVTKREIFNPLVELESDRIREGVIVDDFLVDNCVWYERPYTLANLCNPFSMYGALCDKAAKSIREISNRRFSNASIHKILCNMQVKYLEEHERLPVYKNLNDLIVAAGKFIAREHHKPEDINNNPNWMPLRLQKIIAQSQYKFTEYQLML